jgi:hypothetical protein
MFPELKAAIADIAVFMYDDEGSDFDAAQQRAIDACSSEMLPAVLGGEWSRGKPGVPWSEQYSLELFDHPIWFRRRGTCGQRLSTRLATSRPTSSLRLGRCCGRGSGSG